MRWGLLLVVLGLASPRNAGAVTLVRPDGRVAQPYQRWADASKVPTPRGTVTVYGDRCPEGPWACYYRDGRRLYIDRATIEPLLHAGSDELMAAKRGFFHELFHDFDEGGPLTDGDRAQFMRIMRLHGAWRISDHDHSPNEVFANGAAACALRSRLDTSGAFGGNYEPTARQHRRVCALIRSAGGWYMRRAS